MHQAVTSPQRPGFFRATPKLPNAEQLVYLMDYISSNTTQSRDQSYHLQNPIPMESTQCGEPQRPVPPETKNSQKLQNTFNQHDENQKTLAQQNSSTEIKTTSRNPPSSISSASTNFINSLTIRKKSTPFKSRFKSTPNIQKFDFRQVSANYQLRIINKKVLVSARMRNSSRIIRKFNFVLPETCDTKTFTHRLERGVLEFKWKTAMDAN